LTLLSIIPHEFHPELKEVSHDWIYDPQMWDLWLDGSPTLPDTDLSNRIQKMRQDRVVVIYIGSANKIKGFVELCELARNNRRECLVVVAGKVANECLSEMQTMIDIGMLIENRHVSDEEILSLYKVADYAWCKYLPEYDQSSGVFGRAIQTGVIPVIRDSSIISELGKKLNITSHLGINPLEKRTAPKPKACPISIKKQVCKITITNNASK
jgi:hypothetical protein